MDNTQNSGSQVKDFQASLDPIWHYLEKDFVLLEYLGQGSFGLVIKAQYRSTGKTCAIKLIQNFFSISYDAKQVLREIKILRHLSKFAENLFAIRLLDVIVVPLTMSNGVKINQEQCKPSNETSNAKSLNRKLSCDFQALFLVEEYFNQDMLKLLAQIEPPSKLTEEHIKHVIYNLLCSLNFIHSFNIVHRDIKPANILMNDACQVKLCDFGLARSISSSKSIKNSQNDQNDKTVTKLLNIDNKINLEMLQNTPSGKIASQQYQKQTTNEKEVGTDVAASNSLKPSETPQPLTPRVTSRFYRAPEVILTNPNYSFQVDVWGAGCVLAELLLHKDNDESGMDYQFMFSGDSCFPLSPCNQMRQLLGETQDIIVSERDQLKIILENLGEDQLFDDLDFLENHEDTRVYIEKLMKTLKGTTSIDERLQGTSQPMLDLLKALLQFNPNKRLMASDYLKFSIFDNIRNKEIESLSKNVRLNLKIDQLPNPKTEEQEQKQLQLYKQLILKEARKIKKARKVII